MFACICLRLQTVVRYQANTVERKRFKACYRFNLELYFDYTFLFSVFFYNNNSVTIESVSNLFKDIVVENVVFAVSDNLTHKQIGWSWPRK